MHVQVTLGAHGQSLDGDTVYVRGAAICKSTYNMGVKKRRQGCISNICKYKHMWKNGKENCTTI